MHSHRTVTLAVVLIATVFAAAVIPGLAASSSAEPERAPRIAVPEVQGAAAITIDGKLNEPAWDRAAMVQGFMLFGESKKLHFSPYQSRAMLTYGADCLYVGIASPPTTTAPPVANVKENDGPTWLDDCVELFLDPTPATPDFHQLIVNTRGIITDLRYPQGNGGKPEIGWTLEGCRAGTQVTAEAWVWELAIPYAGLKAGQPAAGSRWLFNLCQSRNGLGPATVCGNVRFAYAEHENFGILTFVGGGGAVRIESFGPLESSQLALKAAYRHSQELPVQAIVRASRYDETADTFFPLFARDGSVTRTAATAVTAPAAKLGNHGKLDVTVRSGDAELYAAVLHYRQLTAVEIEGMRRIESDGATHLRVTTLQPYSPNAETRSVRIQVRDTAGNILHAATQPVRGNKMHVAVDITGSAPGNYSATMQLLGADGNVLNQDGPAPFTVYGAPPWRGNRLGISDAVPPPWTPLQVDAAARNAAAAKDEPVTVSCWNREYEFSTASPLPSAIASGGRQYLEGPITVELTLDGATVKPGAAPHRVTAAAPRSCTMTRTVQARNWALQTDTTVEFDGFIWIDLTLTPPSAPAAKPGAAPAHTLDLLRIVWTMPPEQSRLLNSGIRRLIDTGRTPKRWRRALDSPEPAFWVGNEYGGIAVSAESFQHWRNRDKNRQIELSRDEKGARVSLTMVDSPLAVGADPVRFGFCLHPTPVRPPPAGARKIRTCSWFGAHHFHKPYPITLSIWNATPKYQGAPDWFTSDEGVRRYYRRRKRKFVARVYNYHGLKESGARSSWYGTFSHTARNSPEFIWCGEQWKAGIRDQLYANAHISYWNDMVAVCKTRDYSDYYLWRFDRTRRENPMIDGLYLDLMHLPPCERGEHGHGYTDEKGQRRSTFAIREHRAWLLRIYTYLKEADPETPVVSHLSGHSAHIMAHSFSDILWDGELWVKEVQRDLSYENLSMDALRAETVATAYGPKILWINQLYRALSFLSPEERKSKGLKPYALRHHLAMLLVHDIVPSAGGHEQRYVMALWELFDRFGLEDSDRMLPYWEDATAVTHTPDRAGLLVTSYVKPDRALVIVFNNTDSEETVAVTVNPAALGWSADRQALTFRNAELNKPEALATGTACTVPVPKRDFRILWIE